MLTSVVARCADSHILSYVRLHARAITCILALSGITVVLTHTEPWKLCLLAVIGLIMLPVMFQHSYLLHEQAKQVDVIVQTHGEKRSKNENKIKIDLQQTILEPVMEQYVVTKQPNLPIIDPCFSISMHPVLGDGRKGIMSKNILQIREEMFAKAMGSIRTLSPRNQPVVHHLDLIKYAEEIDDHDDSVL